MFFVYFLISEYKDKTYIGFTDNVSRRMLEHSRGKTKSTVNFGRFDYHVIEEIDNLKQARKREKYWKSCAGRKKLKKLFMALSSSG